MLSTAIVSLLILSLFYSFYEEKMLDLVNGITENNRYLAIFMVTILDSAHYLGCFVGGSNMHILIATLGASHSDVAARLGDLIHQMTGGMFTLLTVIKHETGRGAERRLRPGRDWRPSEQRVGAFLARRSGA